MYKQEATLTRKTKAWLDKQEGLFYYKASDRYQKGVSDFIICYRGKFLALELKAENGKASPHQKLFIKEVEEAGGRGAVCYTLDEVRAFVKGGCSCEGKDCCASAGDFNKGCH